MARTSHIKRRGAVYQAQLAVPLDLQATLGRKTMDRSLRTKDPQEAKRRILDVLKEWRDLFANARRNKGLGVETQLKLSAGQLATRLYLSDIKFDEELRANDHRYAGFEIDATDAAPFRDGYSGKLSDRELEQLVGDRIAYYRQQGLIQAKSDSQEWREIAQALCVARYEGLMRRAERNDGDFTGKPAHPILLNFVPEPSVPQADEEILDLYDSYARENAKAVSTDTLVQGRRDVRLFAETVGNPPASKITKRMVGEYKDLLLLYPVKAAEIAAFRGMTMRQIIKANERVRKPTITSRTVNRHLSALGSFCDWLVRRDYLDINPVIGMHQTVDKAKRSTLPFTSGQLDELFHSPLFCGCQSDDNWHIPGSHLIRDHRYWLPLVMLYSGARPAEIAQLLVEDVRDDKGTWIIHITEINDEEKSVKTRGSMRVVPVHSELVSLGFLDYCSALKTSGERRLFPTAQRNLRGQMVADFSRDFGRYLKRVGLKSGRGLSLYSLRHGFVDALRRAEFLDEQFGFLVGHTSHTMTGQYGQLPQGMLRQRVEMIEQVRYPGLDLSHLMTR